VPGDRDRPLSPVLGIVGLPEEQVGRACAEGGHLLWAGEEEDMAAGGSVIEVALTGLEATVVTDCDSRWNSSGLIA